MIRGSWIGVRGHGSRVRGQQGLKHTTPPQSRLLDFALREVSSAFHGGYVPANKQFIERLPIVVPDNAKTSERGRSRHLSDLGHAMQALAAQLAAARTDPEKEVLQRQIDATDRDIDALVYELYGLTEAEIKIVDGEGNG